jgi:hypothetical protein
VTRAVPAVVLGLLAAACLAGCGDEDSRAAIITTPQCVEGDGGAGHGVILMAQSVPTAAWVPCMRTATPSGWKFQHLDAQDGVSRFWLNSDRDGDRAIEVRLEESCDTSRTTEIASDHAYMHRLERVRQISPTYEGERHYVFRGGCISIVFRLHGHSPGEALALATQVVGVVSREDLQAQVHEDSGGRLELDPPGKDG